jgi:4-hydroxy-tetrahydrodipicolinate reductase
VKVAVIGAAGRMGSEVCRAVEADPDLQLVARLVHDDDLRVITKAGADVAVEFTTPASVKDNVRFCLEHDVHVVVGATGLAPPDLQEVERWAEASKANAFVAPNFAIGAVLMMRFAAAAAPHFDSAEIVERHHEKKIDAPSGTALRTAHLMNEARQRGWEAPPDESETVSGSRGGDVDGIHIHSLRLPGSVAHQEVVLGTAGETLTIRHDSLDRTSFMPGVILAVKKVPSLGPLTVGLEHLLEL